MTKGGPTQTLQDNKLPKEQGYRIDAPDNYMSDTCMNGH